MKPSSLWFLLALGCASSGCASGSGSSPNAPPGGLSRPEREVHRYRISPTQEAIAVRDESGCWVHGIAGAVSSPLSLRFPDAVCSSETPPDWLLAEEIRSDQIDGPLRLLYEPIAFLPLPAGLALARRFLALSEERDPGGAERFRENRWNLELYGDDGVIDEARMPALCNAGNPVACMRGADATSWDARAERACILGLDQACHELSYQRYLAVLAAGRRTAAFPAFKAAICALCYAPYSGPFRDPTICSGGDLRFLGTETCPSIQVAGEPPSREDVYTARRDEFYAAVQRTPEHASLTALLCARGVTPGFGGFAVFEPRLFQGVSCPKPPASPAKPPDP